jgi:general stress protein 26
MLFIHGVLSLFLVWPAAPAQAPSREAILTASRTIISGARYATLVTVGAAGAPDARIVDPFAPESDFTIWFATNAASRKVTELARDPRVTLLYFDAPNKGYVTVKGTAALVRDAKDKAARWKDEWTGMWKNKNLGDDYVLVRVTPETLEVVSVALGMVNDPVTWKPVTLQFR